MEKLGRGKLTRAEIETATIGKEVTVSDIPDARDPSRVTGIGVECKMGINDILRNEGDEVRNQFQELRLLNGGYVVYARIPTGQ